jgi:hypothetical protein
MSENIQQPTVNQQTLLAVQLPLPQWELILQQLAQGSIARFGDVFGEVRNQLQEKLRADG